MKIFFTEEQEWHEAEQEFVMGALRPAMDRPDRAREILGALKTSGSGTVQKPARPVAEAVLAKIHDPGLLRFLQSLHQNWSRAYPGSAPFPEMGLAPGMRRLPNDSLRGGLIYYCFDACTPVGPKTWEAVHASVATAAAGAEALAAGAREAFALCRPPGHHAGSDFYGGYCYLNNAAIAAQTWLQSTGARCAILDVDFHHGNGTQQIFYERDDVYYASIHKSPAEAYPFFSGYEDECGAGAGRGANFNLPLKGTVMWSQYESALLRALEEIRRADAKALIVSLGVDTYAGDPVGGLGLQVTDFEAMGARIAALGIPTLVVMEGGYAKGAVGVCVASFLKGLVEAGSANEPAPNSGSLSG